MITGALRGDLTRWRGLSAETLDSVTEALAPIQSVAGPTYAERRLGAFNTYTLVRSEPPGEIVIWLPVGDPAVALIECDDPPVPDPDAVLDDLGGPEEVQHNQRFRTGVLVDEWAYPARGLNLSVATPHDYVGADPAPRGVRVVVHLQPFRPMTFDDWRAALGVGVPLRPSPWLDQPQRER
jgi:hypothetical protein